MVSMKGCSRWFPVPPIILIISILQALTGYSQPISHRLSDRYFVRVEHIAFPNSGTVNAILRDHRGFLWFGTSRGLCKYDGYQVHLFVNGSSLRAHQNRIETMIELPSPSGRSLLLGTVQGLWRFDLQTEEFSRILPDAEFSNERISALLRDSDATLWIGTGSRGLFSLDSSTRRYSTENGLVNNTVNRLFIDHSGILWIGMGEGAFQALDRKASRFVQSGIGTGIIGSQNKRILSFAENKNHELWIGADEGVGIFDRRAGKLVPIKLPSPLRHTVHAIVSDPAGRMWIGASDLDLLFHANNTFTKVPTSDQAGIESQNTALYVDSMDSDSTTLLLWVGKRGGVEKIHLTRNPFMNHVRNRDGLTLDRGAVLALHEDRSGILWVGLWGGGLEGLRFESDRYKRVYHFEHDPASRSALPDNDVVSLYEDGHRQLWIGTGHGVRVLDPQRKKMTTPLHNDADSIGILNSILGDMIGDRSGAMWIATRRGLVQFLPSSPSKPGNFLHELSDAHPYGGNAVSALHEDRNGTIWACTFGRGLNRYNGNGTFTRFLCASDSTGYHENFIYNIHEDSRGVFWLSIREGLASYDPASNTWESYRIPDLHEGHIYGIWVDQSRNVWLSTEMGLGRFNPGTSSFVRYDARSGMAISRLYSEFAYNCRGKLMVGGLDGFAEFSPDDFIGTSKPPQVAITGVAVFGKPLSPTRLSAQPIQFGYNQNFLTISFAVLDYTDPQRNGFAYRMEGVEEDWVHAGERNYVTYAHLDPGTYVFHVKGYNSNHVWNEAGTIIIFTIAPPFWETWWFRFLIFVLVAGAIYAAYRYRLRKLLEVERLRLRIADDLHDDVGSNLSSISLGSQLVLQRSALDDEARQLIEEIRQNAAHTAETMRDIVWLINPKNDQLEDMILRMRDVAAKLLTGVQYAFTVTGPPPSRIPDLSIRRNLFLMYKESLNNVAKHSKATHVEISLASSDERLVLSVKDNGVGFDLAHPRTGNGLAGLQRRADAVGGTLDVRSSPGHGTIVTASVPLR